MDAVSFTKSEMMIVAAARELAGQRVCFVGVGLPNIAVNLAQRTVAPDIELVYEAGVFGARPARLPLSIGDPTIVTGATAATSMFELFAFYLQGGLIDVGFLGAAQIDPRANLNTTAIGPYDEPKVRLPGAGGAPEIAACAKSVIVIVRHSPRTFVERLDFVTSLAHQGGHTVVITDLGVLRPGADGELELVGVHPGVEPAAVQEATGWDLRLADPVEHTPPVSEHELDALRELRASARR
jgi:glutaconate CoA-transferase, subunit B